MTEPSATDTEWLKELCKHVEAKRCVVLRLDEGDSERLAGSRRGFNEFTLTQRHESVEAIHPPAICLIVDHTPQHARSFNEVPHAHIGIVSSRERVATLDSRIKIKRTVRISPATEDELVKLLSSEQQINDFRKRLVDGSALVSLPPKLSRALIEALASIPDNRPALRYVSESLHAPRRFSSMAAQQEDAVQTALKAFGLGSGDQAERVELVEGQSTALARISVAEDAFAQESPDDLPHRLSRRAPLIEDTVIEHDARSMPGFTLTAPDLTGRAVFKKGRETLQIITANRRDLEHVFGVDLIYMNLTKHNIVMVQYKMLEPNRPAGVSTDWVYRPDQDLADQIAKMKLFSAQHAPQPTEYRLNPQVFYLKFVKRDGALSNGSVITPIDHYQQLADEPASRGKRNGLRISYDALDGRYMRQGAFVDLIKSGYIGAYAQTTDHLAALIQAVVDGERAVVAAVQTASA